MPFLSASSFCQMLIFVISTIQLCVVCMEYIFYIMHQLFESPTLGMMGTFTQCECESQ